MVIFLYMLTIPSSEARAPAEGVPLYDDAISVMAMACRLVIEGEYYASQILKGTQTVHLDHSHENPRR